MRNLTLTNGCIATIIDANLTAVAADLDRNELFVTSEKRSAGLEVQIDIWKTSIWREGSDEHSPSLFTSFKASASDAKISAQVISLRVLLESARIVLILRNGDISMAPLEGGALVEVEGTVDSGVRAATWSPDDSLLALLTGEEKLILMTSDFDILSETPINTSEFGEDAPINVGWGSKQTQFHGSIGKAAQAPSKLTVGSSPDDDQLPRIRWRGDGALFAVSSLSPPSSNNISRRVLRIYDRNASLQSTSEAVAGLEHVMDWRPSGNLIASTQRFGFEGGGAGKAGRHDVVFFERNGLRHGEFGIRAIGLTGGDERGTVSMAIQRNKWGYRVRELSWSSDSYVLAVWIECSEVDIIQLWTTGNYHWYLKHEFSAASFGSSSRFTSCTWDPEVALRMIITTQTEVIQRTYAWDTFASPKTQLNDTGCVAVVDGSSILLTTFRLQNVPPPMYSHMLNSQATSTKASVLTPIHVGFSVRRDALALLWESGHVEIWNLQIGARLSKGKAMEPMKTWSGIVADKADHLSRQVVFWESENLDQASSITRITVLSSDTVSDVLTIIGLEGGLENHKYSLTMNRKNGRLLDSEKTIWQSSDGKIFQVDVATAKLTHIATFPQFCLSSRYLTIDETSIFIGLAPSQKLYISGEDLAPKVLASNVTSFAVASGFVIFTTSAHDVQFAPLSALPFALTGLDDGNLEKLASSWEKRRVERGSRIVTAVSSTMSLILQMPRGNLESISPRPLVMKLVKELLDGTNYLQAFLACRKHRIDLNIIVEHNRGAFMKNIPSFIEQIDDVDYINLFLTSIGRGTQPQNQIAELCDEIRMELERKDIGRYVNSILTAYIVKTPPDTEAGLELLLRLRESEPQLVEDAVKYIIFLVDANKLFDTALGMYDFSLVLMIAQHAQKDPREYLPFLRELRSLELHYQRFRIDDYLRRHEKALRNLSLAGYERFEETTKYIEKHKLYEASLPIWKGTEQYPEILDLYGNWLFERREFEHAGLIFVEAGNPSKAMVVYEKALEWQELFEIAVQQSKPDEEIKAMAYRVAEDLSSKKRFSDASRVLLDYAQDVREAVIRLVQGNLFSEARRIISLHSAPELLTDVVYPGTLESRAQVAEDIEEMREQLRKQLERLRELRLKKVEEPEAFYGTENVNLHNVDVMTDVSMPATAFTRYTVAPTTTSKTSKRSSRSKRKLERKVGSGRKGTVDEEEYLLKSVSKLVARYDVTQAEAGKLLPHLAQFTVEHRAEGLALQGELKLFHLELADAIDEIWRRPDGESAGSEVLVEGGLVSRAGEEKESSNPLDKVVKPIVPGLDWRIGVYNAA